MIKLNAKELRTTEVMPEEAKKIRRNPIYIIVDNVLDTYNIGSIFRLADAVAAEEVILCGESLTPPHTRIKKAAINTTEVVRWRYEKTAGEAIRELKRQNTELRIKLASLRQPRRVLAGGRSGNKELSNGGLKIVAIEQDKRSVPYAEIKWSIPVALVVGNESFGVSKEVLVLCDEIVELPMWGVNKSLNVVVSLGIVLYEVMKKVKS